MLHTFDYLHSDNENLFRYIRTKKIYNYNVCANFTFYSNHSITILFHAVFIGITWDSLPPYSKNRCKTHKIFNFIFQ